MPVILSGVKDLVSEIGLLIFIKESPITVLTLLIPKKLTPPPSINNAPKRPKDTTARGKIPIIAGGTGFWIDAAVYDLNLPEVSPNFALRKTLEKKNIARLLQILKKLDPRRAQTIEQKNPRRLIRAIEIARVLGKVPSLQKKSPYRVFWIGIRPTDLEKRVSNRVKKMIAGGIIRETKRILKQKVSKKRIKEFGFEYRAVLECLENKLTPGELAGKMAQGSLDYVRRQMVWFKRNKKIHWIKNPGEAEKLRRLYAEFTNQVL